MQDFVAHTSRWRTALIIVGSISFVGCGVWMAGLLGPVPASRRAGPLMLEFWGWLTLVFFGICAIVGAKAWWINAERLRINKSGIFWTGWCDQTIPWSEITNVTEWRYKSNRHFILHLRDPSRFPGKGLAGLAGRANRVLTGGDVGISLVGTDRKFDEAMSAIEMFRPNQ